MDQEDGQVTESEIEDQNAEIEENESLLDRMAFITERDGEVNISVLGSSVTLGEGTAEGTAEGEPAWADLLQNDLNDRDGIEAEIKNDGYSGYTTTDLIENGIIDEVVSNGPDIIFFELCLINNSGLQVSLEQTTEDIAQIVNRFNEELPETLVILQTANPISDSDSTFLQSSLSYDEYNTEIIAFLEENDLHYIDTYHLMLQEMEQRTIAVDDTLDDPIHPNVEGYRIWFDVLVEQLDVPLEE